MCRAWIWSRHWGYLGWKWRYFQEWPRRVHWIKESNANTGYDINTVSVIVHFIFIANWKCNTGSYLPHWGLSGFSVLDDAFKTYHRNYLVSVSRQFVACCHQYYTKHCYLWQCFSTYGWLDLVWAWLYKWLGCLIFSWKNAIIMTNMNIVV